jgi:hypothetical protein
VSWNVCHRLGQILGQSDGSSRGSRSGTSLVHGTKISSPDPALLPVSTAYPSEPFQVWPALFHPPIKLASVRPRRQFYLDGNARKREGNAVECGLIVIPTGQRDPTSVE